MTQVLISVAPNGARKTTSDLPHIPITTPDIVKEAVRCAAAGASLFHLHVRDDQQRHSLDPKRYKEALQAISAEIGDALILQVTTETVEMYTPPEMIETIQTLSPEAFSVGVRELIPATEYEAPAKDFLYWSYHQGIQIQYILYSKEDVHYFSRLIETGTIPKQSHYFLLFVLGKKTGLSAEVSDLLPYLEAKDRYLSHLKTTFAVCAFGPKELDCMLAAVSSGGHVRLGFENNHLLKNGTVADSTAALVHQFRDHAGCKPYSAAEISALLK